MSSVQQVRDEAQFCDEQKAAVAEALKEAKSYLANNNCVNAASQFQVALTAGSIKKFLRRAVRLYESHNFTGKFLVDPPANAEGYFLHQGATSQGHLPVVVGSKAALKYGHIDKMPNPLGYILAWDNPDNANGDKKVFVLAGPRDKIMAMNWCEIEEKLDASDSLSKYPEIGIKLLAIAKIEDMGNKLATIGANFYDG